MDKSHASSSKSKPVKRAHVLERFDDIFTCTICLMKLDNPHLCPQCSKLYCYDCISQWLLPKTEQRLHCPNCKFELQLDKLVKVRWFEEAEKLQRNCVEPVAKVSSTNKPTTSTEDVVQKKNICSKHRSDINLYCSTCNLCVCYVCADENHMDHTFKILDMIYDSELNSVQDEFEQVRERAKKTASLIEKVDHNEELLNMVKEDKLEEVRLYAKRAIEGLKQQANDVRLRLKRHKSTLLAEMKEIEQTLGAMEREVAASSRSQLIAKKPRIVKECNKVQTIPIKDFNQIWVPISLKIEIPLIYETGIFVLESFSSLLETESFVSDNIIDNFGHIWSISVDCDIPKDELGVYLDFVEGLPCRVEFDFQLLHADPERIIQRKGMHQFDRASQRSWGYHKFASLKTISDGNYLKADSLELLYQIRPCGADDSGNGKPLLHND